MANSKIRLTYFDFNGRAEITRLTLTWAGKEYEDRRVSRDDWPKHKPTSPFGQVPFIEIDGKSFAQSLAIATFCAREFKLYGSSNLDALKIDQFLQLMDDFIKEVVKALRESDEAKKAEITKTVKEEHAPRFLGYSEKLVEENKGEFFLGSKFSLADIAIFDLFTGFLKPYVEHLQKNYSHLNKIVEYVGKNEKIQAYLAKHK